MIKDCLLDTYRCPLDEMLSEFVETASLGGLRPSTFVYKICALSADATIEDVRRAVLMHSLPPGPKSALLNSSSDIRTLGREADKFFDINGGLNVTTSAFIAASAGDADNAENVAAFHPR